MSATTTAAEQREFARILVSIQTRIQPLDPERADRLRQELLCSPSVWAPHNEAALRNLAAGDGTETAAVLAQAVLELSGQIVRLRARLLESEAPVRGATLIQLSGGGGRLATDLGLGSGDEFEIRLEDEDSSVPPIRALARVVHRAADGVGFRFEAIHASDRERLIRLIYTLQRRAIREAGREGD